MSAESSEQPPEGAPTACSEVVVGGAAATVASNSSVGTDRFILQKPDAVIVSDEQTTIVTEHPKHFPTSVGTVTEEENLVSSTDDSTASDTHTHVSPAQQVDDWETGKAGIAFVCVSCGLPSDEDYIKNCTAGDKMVECLGTQLGYHTIPVKNMTSADLDDLLDQIERRTLPASYHRAIFYFFGHGNATSIKMADGVYIERHYIVKKFQSICPPDADITKTIIFESCRLTNAENAVTFDAVQESATLSVSECSSDGGPYPVYKHTIVVDATNFNNKAHYRCCDGCGLFTQKFTELAPILNVSFYDLLVEVRNAVVKETPDKEKEKQLLDFKDMLMQSVYLLAESQGAARVQATDLSATPSALATTIEWRCDGNVQDRIECFEIELSPTTDHIQRPEILEPSARHATISGLGSVMVYSVTVITVYNDGERIEGKTSISFTSPARLQILDVQPENTSATITFTDPASADRKELKYSTREARGGQNGRNQSGKFRKVKRYYSPGSSRSSSATSIDQQQSIGTCVISNFKAGTKNLVKLRAEYANGESIESEVYDFDTPPFTDAQKARCCCGYFTIYSFLSVLFLASLFLCGSYGAYDIKLRRSSQCQTDYVVTYNSIDCGEANSLQYSKITVSGSQQTGDTLLGTMKAWLVPKKELTLHGELQRPVRDGASITDRQPVLLNGWQIYMWKGSIIYGYCCITNNGTTEQTASLHMFTSDEDTVHFLNGQEARNVILSDTIRIPPGRQMCFRKWGIDAPFTVYRNSHHFIGVDVPANSAFSSNITVLQMTANTSVLGEPQQFKFNTETSFELSRHPFSANEYIIICQAPSSFTNANLSDISAITDNRPISEPGTEMISLATRVGAESLHVDSCKEPYNWMGIAFPISLGVGILLFIVIVAVFIAVCVCMCKCHKERLFGPWSAPPQYSGIPATD